MNHINTSSPKKHKKEIDIFNLRYPGLVPFGRFTVGTIVLNNGLPCGGGMVAEFNTLEMVKKCIQIILKIHPNHKPTVWDNETEKTLDLEKSKKDKRQAEELEYAKYLKNPLEFDTQTRQEIFNNDTGALPNQRRVTSDPYSMSKHDYRHLKSAYELTEYNEEPSTKAPFIIENSRRLANELFYEEVIDHNKSDHSGYGGEWMEPSEEFPENLDEEGEFFMDYSCDNDLTEINEDSNLNATSNDCKDFESDTIDEITEILDFKAAKEHEKAKKGEIDSKEIKYMQKGYKDRGIEEERLTSPRTPKRMNGDRQRSNVQRSKERRVENAIKYKKAA